MARPMPLQYTEAADEASPAITREGYVSLSVIPRAAPLDESTPGVFEKDKKISVKLRSRQIGQLVGWNGRSNLSLTAYSKSVPVGMDWRTTADGDISLSLKPSDENSQPITLTLSAGDVRSFQVLLEAALPHLYGWVGPSSLPRKSAYNTATSTTSKSPEEFFKQFTAAG